MSQFRFEIDHLGSSGGMELFHPGKGFEITFHINFGSFYENPVQDAAIFIVQTAQNCSNRSVNWEAWNILPQNTPVFGTKGCRLGVTSRDIELRFEFWMALDV